MKHTFINNERAESESLGAILAIIAMVLIAVVYFALIPMIGSKLDTAADLQGEYATGTLTFSGNASDGELVNISDQTLEFNSTGTTSAGNIQVNVSASELFATGTLTCSGVSSDGELINVSGVTFELNLTAPAANAAHVEVNISDTAILTTVTNLTAAVNTNGTTSALVTATNTSTTVNLTADAAGAAGNSIATTTNMSNGAWGAATLTGGSDANTLPATATANLSAAINANATLSALLTSADTATTVTLTADAVGTAGNVNTTETCTNAAFGAATMTGGVDADANWVSDDIATGVDLWADVGGMVGIAFIIAIVAVILFMLKREFD